jgi:hypothetical protein
LSVVGEGAIVLSEQSKEEREMEKDFVNLAACCDGEITMAKLKRFQSAIAEFNEFFRLGAEMCRPVSGRHEGVVVTPQPVC